MSELEPLPHAVGARPAVPWDTGLVVFRWTAATCLAWFVSLLIPASPPWIVLVSMLVGGAQGWAIRPYARRWPWWTGLTIAGGVAAMVVALTFIPIMFTQTSFGENLMTYPLSTAVPLAVAQAVALLAMSEHRARAAGWLLVRPLMVTVVSLAGGMLALQASGPHSNPVATAMAYTLYAGLPSALLSGLYLAWVLRPAARSG
jgi:hypothetical protein